MNPFIFEFIIEIITIKKAIKYGDINDNAENPSIKLKFIPVVVDKKELGYAIDRLDGLDKLTGLDGLTELDLDSGI